MKLSDSLGAPRIIAPELAYRRPDVYRAGADLSPRKDDLPYQEYVMLGRLPIVEGQDSIGARDAAREKYGPRANVFRTARYWVAYVVR